MVFVDQIRAASECLGAQLVDFSHGRREPGDVDHAEVEVEHLLVLDGEVGHRLFDTGVETVDALDGALKLVHRLALAFKEPRLALD